MKAHVSVFKKHRWPRPHPINGAFHRAQKPQNIQITLVQVHTPDSRNAHGSTFLSFTLVCRILRLDRSTTPLSRNITQQLRLQDILPLLILLTGLKSFVILPSHRLIALSTSDVSNDMSAGRHVSLAGIARGDVDYIVEEVCFTMLTTKVLKEVSLRHCRS